MSRRGMLFGALVAAFALQTSAYADTLWDTGAPHQVISSGTTTYIGYSSGAISAASPQRWAAIPFAISAGGAIIDQVDIDWFIVTGSEAANVNYIIWRRTGLAAPVNGDQVSSGILGTYADGIDDPRVPGADTFLHEYLLGDATIPLAGGNYYFTMYADGVAPPNTSGFTNAAWLTGGDLQDESLEQTFMWRSAAFPAPGFVAYTAGGAIQPVAGQDPDDRWNPSFALFGTRVPEPATCLLLALAGLAGLRRRKAA